MDILKKIDKQNNNKCKSIHLMGDMENSMYIQHDYDLDCFLSCGPVWNYFQIFRSLTRNAETQ